MTLTRPRGTTARRPPARPSGRSIDIRDSARRAVLRARRRAVAAQARRMLSEIRRERVNNILALQWARTIPVTIPGPLAPEHALALLRHKLWLDAAWLGARALHKGSGRRDNTPSYQSPRRGTEPLPYQSPDWNSVQSWPDIPGRTWYVWRKPEVAHDETESVPRKLVDHAPEHWTRHGYAWVYRGQCRGQLCNWCLEGDKPRPPAPRAQEIVARVTG